MDPETLKRRIEAARILRGLSQAELGRRLEADGLGKHDAGRIERGELTMRRVHLDALRRHLELPEWWFTADALELPDDRPASLEERLDEILERLSEPDESGGGLLGEPPGGLDPQTTEPGRGEAESGGEVSGPANG